MRVATDLRVSVSSRDGPEGGFERAEPVWTLLCDINGSNSSKRRVTRGLGRNWEVSMVSERRMRSHVPLDVTPGRPPSSLVSPTSSSNVEGRRYPYEHCGAITEIGNTRSQGRSLVQYHQPQHRGPVFRPWSWCC